jgi:hypothetical protein
VCVSLHSTPGVSLKKFLRSLHSTCCKPPIVRLVACQVRSLCAFLPLCPSAAGLARTRCGVCSWRSAWDHYGSGNGHCLIAWPELVPLLSAGVSVGRVDPVAWGETVSQRISLLFSLLYGQCSCPGGQPRDQSRSMQQQVAHLTPAATWDSVRSLYRQSSCPVDQPSDQLVPVWDQHIARLDRALFKICLAPCGYCCPSSATLLACSLATCLHARTYLCDQRTLRQGQSCEP